MASPHVNALYPQSALLALDTLWFQVAGTVCNLQCTHCFISCSPTNHTHEMMTLEQVRGYLAEARALGVREYYFTGGEPFLHRDLLAMIGAALQQGPVSVLTNGVLIKPETAAALRALADGSEYSLDLRVSLDGWDAPTNDAIRGAGTFTHILAGVAHLAQQGLNPVITVTAAVAGADTAAGRTQLLGFLREIGLKQPRLKVLPLLRLGAEAERSRPYTREETLRGWMLTAEESAALQCSSGRMATAKGVYVCPILLDEPGARLGATLAGSLRPFTLRHAACFTCHQEGLTCRT